MRRARSKRFRSLGQELPGVLRRLGLGPTIAAQRAVAQWPVIAGERLAAHTRALDVDGKTLLVEVDSPMWLTELKFMKGELMKAVCRRVGGGLITDVRFMLRQADRPR